MKINLQILEQYVSEGYVTKQVHPKYPLAIYNYTQSTQYEKNWDEITLSCRGLIMDTETGEIVARSFPKFFNLEELDDKTKVSLLSNHKVSVQKKLDGSLGIIFNYKGEWILCTKGSFTSEQSIRGKQILTKKYDLKKFNPAISYICEIIYPENRIVCDYQDAETLVFLTAFIDNVELEEDIVQEVFLESGIDIKDTVYATAHTKETSLDLLSNLKAQNIKNEEGYVLRFMPSNYRIKIKFSDYVALHRIMTQCSSYDIWENLSKFNKVPDELLDNVPDEFYDWIRAEEISILSNFAHIYALHAACLTNLNLSKTLSRAEVAKAITSVNQHKISHKILFAMYDGKLVHDMIWPLVKPAYSKPFSKF